LPIDTKSNPNIVLGRPFTTFVPCIEHPARFNQEQLDLLFREGLVLDALWDHEHLPRRNMGRAIPKIDPEITFYHDERLIGIFMIVPNEVTLQLHDLELIVIHLGDDLWLPLLVEQPEPLAEADRFVAHVTPPSFDRSLSFVVNL
jgi:hypothetical protein